MKILKTIPSLLIVLLPLIFFCSASISSPPIEKSSFIKKKKSKAKKGRRKVDRKKNMSKVKLGRSKKIYLGMVIQFTVTFFLVLALMSPTITLFFGYKLLLFIGALGGGFISMNSIHTNEKPNKKYIFAAFGLFSMFGALLGVVAVSFIIILFPVFVLFVPGALAFILITASIALLFGSIASAEENLGNSHTDFRPFGVALGSGMILLMSIFLLFFIF